MPGRAFTGQNKLKAMTVLRSRLYEMERRRKEEVLTSERRSQVGTGERSEKVRTYNYPQNRVTDHRINYSSHNLEAILDGDIDEMIDAWFTMSGSNGWMPHWQPHDASGFGRLGPV